MNRPLYRLAVFVASLSVLLVGSVLHAAEGVTLRYNMEAGEKLIYETESEVEQTQTFNNMDYNVDLKSMDISVRTVQKVDEEGNFHLQTENKRMKFALDTAQTGKYEFDSESSERDTSSLIGAAVTPLFERLSGAIFTLTVNPRGEVIEMDGYEELVGDLLEGNPIAQQFASGGSDEAAKMGMSESYLYLPEGPVKPGDTWEQPYTVDLPQIGKSEGKRIYKYIGDGEVNRTPTVKVGVTHQMKFDLNVENDAATVTGTLSIGNSSGTVHFDPEAGRILKKETSYTLSGNMMVTAGGNTIPINMNQKQQVKVELLDELPE